MTGDFDAWFAEQFPDVTDDETHFDRGEIWEAWQAGRAAERERILNDDRESDPAASVYRLGHQHGRDAERKRIRQLAIKHKASYYVGAKHDVTFSGLFREFADLLDSADA